MTAPRRFRPEPPTGAFSRNFRAEPSGGICPDFSGSAGRRGAVHLSDGFFDAPALPGAGGAAAAGIAVSLCGARRKSTVAPLPCPGRARPCPARRPDDRLPGRRPCRRWSRRCRRWDDPSSDLDPAGRCELADLGRPGGDHAAGRPRAAAGDRAVPPRSDPVRRGDGRRRPHRGAAGRWGADARAPAGSRLAGSVRAPWSSPRPAFLALSSPPSPPPFARLVPTGNGNGFHIHFREAMS